MGNAGEGEQAVVEGARHIDVGANPQGGRDFVAGDVHGEFEKLERALERVGFAPERDRLLSVGDLIDRGPDSDAALAWLESGRIAHAVRGNHEQMMIEAFASSYDWVRAECALGDGEDAAGLWNYNGGEWWWKRTRGADEERRWMRALLALPYTMTVASAHGPVGIIHAQPVESTWSASVARCAHTGREGRAARLRAVWSRLRYGLCQREIGERGGEWSGGCEDVRAVVSGHTPISAPEWKANVLNIDTGAFRPNGRMTLARIDCDPIETESE